MTVDEFTAAAAAFRNEFMTLATKYRSDPFALERTFLSAIPDQFEAERATEIRDINRAEGQGKALSFSWDELVGGMAAAVSRARSAPPTAHDTEVNAAERERFDRARLEREKRENGDGRPGQSALVFPGGARALPAHVSPCRGGARGHSAFSDR